MLNVINFLDRGNVDIGFYTLAHYIIWDSTGCNKSVQDLADRIGYNLHWLNKDNKFTFSKRRKKKEDLIIYNSSWYDHIKNWK